VEITPETFAQKQHIKYTTTKAGKLNNSKLSICFWGEVENRIFFPRIIKEKWMFKRE